MGFRTILALAAAGLSLAPPAALSAQEVAAVLSSESAYYRAALAEFEQAHGGPVPRSVLSEKEPRLSRGTRVVITFGTRAAGRKYPGDPVIISCLSSSTPHEPGEDGQHPVWIHIHPSPLRILARLKGIQPELRALTVFRISTCHKEFFRGFQEGSQALGIHTSIVRLKDADELLKKLRALRRKPDAIWLPPDPLLINARSFATLKEYSRSHGVPLYVPTAGLVEKGGTASVYSSFRAIGRAAADAVRRALAGEPLPREVYPEPEETSINTEAATLAGLDVPQKALDTADRLVP